MKKRTKIKKIRQSSRKMQIITIVLLPLTLFPSIAFAAVQSAEVLPAPDLTLNSSDILFSPENPTVGQPVNITAIIENIGNATARNVTVDFYIYSKPARESIGDIPPYSSKSVSINYIFLSAGSHTIVVKVDPDNTIIEENEMNNNISMTIYISPPSTPTPPRGGGGGAYHRYFAAPTSLAPGDTTPPVITNVSVTLGHSVIITWDTNEISDSLVKYGTKSREYTLEEHNTTYVLSHAIRLKELKENSTYYFVVNSTDPSGNAAETPEYIFILTPPSKEETIIKAAFPYLPHFIISWWIALIPIIAALILTFIIYERYKHKEKE